MYILLVLLLPAVHADIFYTLESLQTDNDQRYECTSRIQQSTAVCTGWTQNPYPVSNDWFTWYTQTGALNSSVCLKIGDQPCGMYPDYYYTTLVRTGGKLSSREVNTTVHADHILCTDSSCASMADMRNSLVPSLPVHNILVGTRLHVGIITRHNSNTRTFFHEFALEKTNVSAASFQNIQCTPECASAESLSYSQFDVGSSSLAEFTPYGRLADATMSNIVRQGDNGNNTLVYRKIMYEGSCVGVIAPAWPCEAAGISGSGTNVYPIRNDSYGCNGDVDRTLMLYESRGIQEQYLLEFLTTWSIGNLSQEDEETKLQAFIESCFNTQNPNCTTLNDSLNTSAVRMINMYGRPMLSIDMASTEVYKITGLPINPYSGVDWDRLFLDRLSAIEGCPDVQNLTISPNEEELWKNNSEAFTSLTEYVMLGILQKDDQLGCRQVFNSATSNAPNEVQLTALNLQQASIGSIAPTTTTAGASIVLLLVLAAVLGTSAGMISEHKYDKYSPFEAAVAAKDPAIAFMTSLVTIATAATILGNDIEVINSNTLGLTNGLVATVGIPTGCKNIQSLFILYVKQTQQSIQGPIIILSFAIVLGLIPVPLALYILYKRLRTYRSRP